MRPVAFTSQPAIEQYGRRSRRELSLDEMEQVVRWSATAEHIFRILKRIFGFAKVRYQGIAKRHNRLLTNFALVNPYLYRKSLEPLGA